MRVILPFIACVYVFIALPAQAAYEGTYVGEQIEYKAADEDTFVHLARDYNLGFTEMRAANPYVDPWLPGEGTTLILPTRHLLPDAPNEGIVINLPEMRLYAFVNGDKPPSTFPIGVGREGLNTPVGTTKITRKKAGPTWTPTPRMRKEDPDLKPFYPPGPDNPLGTHALYLGWPTYAIHGTNRPFGIGRRISSGCIRMYPETITKLFDLIPVGTKVTVVDQPLKVGWIGDRLYIEAHANIDQSIEMEETGVIKAPKLNDDDLARIIKVAGASKDKIRWPALRTAVKERSGYPVEIARRARGDAAQVGDTNQQEEQNPERQDSERINGAADEAVAPSEIKNGLAELYGEQEAQNEGADAAENVVKDEAETARGTAALAGNTELSERQETPLRTLNP